MYHFLFPAISHIVTGLLIAVFGMVLALRRKEPFYNSLKLELLGAIVGTAAFIQGVLIIISHKDPESSCKISTTLCFSLYTAPLPTAGLVLHTIIAPIATS